MIEWCKAWLDWLRRRPWALLLVASFACAQQSVPSEIGPNPAYDNCPDLFPGPPAGPVEPLQVIPPCNDWRLTPFTGQVELYCASTPTRVWLSLDQCCAWSSSRNAKNRLTLTCTINGAVQSQIVVYPYAL